MSIIVRPGWYLPEREATPERLYLGRRDFLKTIGAGALSIGAASAGLLGCMRPGYTAQPATHVFTGAAKRNPKYTLDRPLTDEKVAGMYNNYYEFTTDKEEVAEASKGFTTKPWEVEVTGLVNKPKKWDLGELVKAMPMEERLYRHRCVEAWSMAVPWTGFPFAALLKLAEPQATAKYVKFVSVNRPSEMPGIKDQKWYPWPYFEGLTMGEAMNELSFMVTGIYGHDLPPQHGAPLRLAMPWKYGYKSPKAIVKIELTATQPPTFWNSLAPNEYGFESNVDPQKPHPRWSQAHERVIGTGDRRATLLYNGYGDYVAGLYKT
jgi:sulfoxide reductase catalytic subunit YedY